MGENVKVAVRVRPFNEREKNCNATCIIEMNGNSTLIKDPNNPTQKPRQFTFDHSYWSHDGFKTLENGYLEAEGKKYSDQKMVFNDLGQGVLDNAWKGYNCCLFAYGQTGSGKSYSIVGYGANKGIVPIVCEELFKGIETKKEKADKSKEEEFQVSISMMEIYNEQVRDLLNAKGFKVKGGLKIREHPDKGFYAQSLIKVPVKSYEDINGRINEGTRNRTIASTKMNATSSRAHTIVSITFAQKGLNDAGKNMTKTSIINLVDLAGSERVDSSGATGDRLKEGTMINQSLSSLGNCIKALADLSAHKKTLVPYRNSKLTMLLKNALGGNSKTIMIAAISPADINFDETLSTLRYADRAKSIKTKAVVNESPTDKLIRELKEENARLMEELEKSKQGGGGITETATIMQGFTEAEVEQMKHDLMMQLKQNEDEMDAVKKTWEQRLSEANAANKEKLEQERQKQEEIKVTPHFWNLNEDPALTGIVVHFAKKGVSRIGNDKAKVVPEIVLSGLSIQAEHAVVSNDRNCVKLTVQPGAKTLVNGKETVGEVELHHNDRIMFGSKHLFVFHHPQDLAKHKQKPEIVTPVTYDQAQKEIAANSGFDMQHGPGKSKEELLLQEDLIEIVPMVSEVNAMSEELKKNVRFQIALISPKARGLKNGHTEVMIIMKNIENENEFLWNKDKFLNRRYLMQEMYQDFVEGDKDWDREKEMDPFWEPPDTEIVVGNAHIYLQPLGYQIELEETVWITDYRGNEQGHLRVEIYPCRKDGSELPDEDFVDDPKDLIGKEAHYKLKIPYGRGLPVRIAKSCCKFQFYIENAKSETKEISGTRNPEYCYERIIHFNPVTQKLIDYLATEMLVIQVAGRQKEGGTQRVGRAKQKTSATSKSSNSEENDEDKYKLMVDLNTERKKVEKLQQRLHKLHDVIQTAKEEKRETLYIKEVEDILHSGNSLVKFRAVGRIVGMNEVAKKKGDGRTTSAACSLQ
ncbi:kinesin-like protein KIF28P [Anneissia japonica]|uniref:kinesin-like protein KIF28P n=1 Tax=Anneissia japonica TaxID=1529436 RepID=UPI001425894C|nr:kinesin-like protein KIF28P [Anneissia japonica]